MLTALGRNPVLLTSDRPGLSRSAWPFASPWAMAAGIQDVFVDRAGTLPVDRVEDLARPTGPAAASGARPPVPVPALDR